MLYTVNAIRTTFNGNVPAFCQSVGCDGPNVNVTRMMVEAGFVPPDYQLETLPGPLFLMSNSDVVRTPMGAYLFYAAGDWGVYGNIFGVKIVPVLFNTDTPECIQVLAAVNAQFKDNADLNFVEAYSGGGNPWTGSLPIPPEDFSDYCPPLSAGDNSLMFYFSIY